MNLCETLTSLVKLCLHPRRASVSAAPRPRPLIILGNGPSLNDTLASSLPALESHPLMAVNFFANSPLFARLKPEFYVLADPHFFANPDDPNVSRLMTSLAAADWPLTLFLPFGAAAPALGANVRVERFPMTAVEGSARLERLAYSARLAMPRPRNVLIPSIMLGVWLGFTEIYIVGADHSWPTTVSVNERNEVVSVQPHFYKEDNRELERIRVNYLHRPLHDVMLSWYIAFRSYHQIERWAARRSVSIFNATPGSFIDAFTRKRLPDDRH